MKKIAIIIQSPPHGTSSGREALDCALALSSEHAVSLYLIGAGIFHLLNNQDPEQILSRNYIKTFSLLELYDVEQVYYATEDLMPHKFLSFNNFSFPATELTQKEIAQKWTEQDVILTF